MEKSGIELPEESEKYAVNVNECINDLLKKAKYTDAARFIEDVMHAQFKNGIFNGSLTIFALEIAKRIAEKQGDIIRTSKEKAMKGEPFLTIELSDMTPDGDFGRIIKGVLRHSYRPDFADLFFEKTVEICSIADEAGFEKAWRTLLYIGNRKPELKNRILEKIFRLQEQNFQDDLIPSIVSMAIDRKTHPHTSKKGAVLMATWREHAFVNTCWDKGNKRGQCESVILTRADNGRVYVASNNSGCETFEQYLDELTIRFDTPDMLIEAIRQCEGNLKKGYFNPNPESPSP